MQREAALEAAKKSHDLSNSCWVEEFCLDYINWKWNGNYIKTTNKNKLEDPNIDWCVHAGGCEQEKQK